MAHFAKLNEGNEVTEVIVVSNDVITVDGAESEQAGIDFLEEIFGHSNWKQTSYSGSFRKNFATIGAIYDASRDAFMAPKLHDSWTLNEDTCRWETSVSKPDDGKDYVWNDASNSWVERSEPVEAHHA